ncbi:hypothetical protein PEPS_45670 (plasmid) [Persicobacter psychrovividus]|uniref:Uncharacterized protein n=1 Tax=Persicobacter psychrovividus TaxID=387638 RepID=A0ABM7VMR1_9BACT|nr:hypothetical protein PEPS_45670 [Persicobacter psychrovividus]
MLKKISKGIHDYYRKTACPFMLKLKINKGQLIILHFDHSLTLLSLQYLTNYFHQRGLFV